MLICRNAEGVHGKQKVGNPCSRQTRVLRSCNEISTRVASKISITIEKKSITISRKNITNHDRKYQSRFLTCFKKRFH